MNFVGHFQTDNLRNIQENKERNEQTDGRIRLISCSFPHKCVCIKRRPWANLVNLSDKKKQPYNYKKKCKHNVSDTEKHCHQFVL